MQVNADVIANIPKNYIQLLFPLNGSSLVFGASQLLLFTKELGYL